MSKIEIGVPPLPESVSEVSIGSFNVKEGDFVNADDVICELETDKASLEVTATESGVVSSIKFGAGDIVKESDVLCAIDTSKDSASVEKKNDNEDSRVKNDSHVIKSKDDQQGSNADSSPVASPAAKKILSDNNIDRSAVSPTTKKGVISKKDALSHVSNNNTKVSNVTDSSSGSGTREIRRVKMTKLRKVIARKLKESQDTAAMLTTFNEVNMDNIMAIRGKYKDLFEKKHGVKLGFMSIFSKAVALALMEIPGVNAEIDGDEIVYRNYADISVAVSTEKGLVVPVVRNVQNLNLHEIEKEIIQLAGKARDGSLSVDEMMGGTFTITNGGVFGSLLSTPIINFPQSAILGMHTIQKRPVVVNDEIKIANMMYLALSYDHRIVDGKEAVTFLKRVKEMIEDPARIFLGM